MGTKAPETLSPTPFSPEFFTEESTAYHGIIVIKNGQPILTWANPTLIKQINIKDFPVTPNNINIPLHESYPELSSYITQAINHQHPDQTIISFTTGDTPGTSEDSITAGFTLQATSQKDIYLLTGRNITDKEIIRHNRHRKETHDSMTKIFNRKGFTEIINIIQTEKRESSRINTLGVIYIDLDNVKKINDAQGHLAGDQYIIECFNEIAKLFRAGDHEDDLENCLNEQRDLLIRINDTGDELLILIPEATETVMSQLNLRLETFQTQNQEKYPFSFGLANHQTPTGQSNIFSRHDDNLFSIDQIIDSADTNMQKNKNSRKKSDDSWPNDSEIIDQRLSNLTQ